jgi:hypothetical protein
MSKVNIDLLINTANSAKSLKETKQAIKELKSAALEVGEGTEEFKRLTQAAGKLTDKVGDVNQRIKVLSGDTQKLQGAIGVVQGLAGAFGAVQGAAALFGGNSEKLQQTLVKLQATMTMMNGLQQVANMLNKDNAASIFIKTAAQKAYNIVVGTSTGALKAFRIALAATGIGLAVVAVALLVENWDKLTKAIGLSNDSVKEKAKEFENYIETVKRVEESHRNLERSIEDITLILAKEKGQISETGAEFQKIMLERKRALEDLRQEYDKNIDALSKETLSVSEAMRKRLVLETEFSNKKEEINKTFEAKQEIIQIKADKKAEDLRKSNNDKRKQEQERIDKILLAIKRATQDELLKIEQSGRQQELTQAEVDFQRAKTDSNGNKKIIEALTEQHRVRLMGINKKYDELQAEQDRLKREEELNKMRKWQEEYEEEVKKKEKERQQRQEDINNVIINGAAMTSKAAFDIIHQQMQSNFDKQMSNIEASKNAQLAALDAERDARNVNFEAMSAEEKAKFEREQEYQQKRAVIEREAAEQKRKLQQEQFKRQKKAALIEAAIQTAIAVIAGLSKPAVPPFPSAILAGIAGATQIATIASQPIPQFAKGGLVKGVGTGTSDSITAKLSNGESVINAKSTAMFAPLLSKINQAGGGVPLIPRYSKGGVAGNGIDMDRLERALSKDSTPVIKTYVVESEMTASQKRIKTIENRSKF